MRYLLIMSLFSVLFASACTQQLPTTNVQVGGVTVIAEIADDDRDRTIGLMNRSSLPEGAGMIFVFDDEKQRSFWMKNTLIPLDMIFISANGTIVDITTMQPCKSLFCESYRSKQPAKYVLEVNAGFAEKHSTKVGDFVNIKLK
jgi:uncharacterized membrane protein (UPF0127 family)